MSDLIPPSHAVTLTDLHTHFANAHSWETRYRQLILLARQLPGLSDDQKIPQFEISGCENRVWLVHHQDNEGYLHFAADSEGRIVKGLLVVLLTAIEGKSPQELVQTSPLSLFQALGLDQQLSASRAQGLHSLVTAVQKIATDALQTN